MLYLTNATQHNIRKVDSNTVILMRLMRPNISSRWGVRLVAVNSVEHKTNKFNEAIEMCQKGI